MVDVYETCEVSVNAITIERVDDDGNHGMRRKVRGITRSVVTG